MDANLKIKLLQLGAASIIATSGVFVATWEGKSNIAYQDLVGVWTICYGETANVKKGQHKTTEQCNASLARELTEYNKQMNSVVKVTLEPYEEIAYTSFVWNLGITNFKKSTLLKKLNAGYKAQACEELLKWNRAGGKVVQGLVNRRQAEHKLCLGKDEAINKLIKEE